MKRLVTHFLKKKSPWIFKSKFRFIKNLHIENYLNKTRNIHYHYNHHINVFEERNFWKEKISYHRTMTEN